ncbi:MAG: cell division protein FtsX [Bacteroidetes bacterium]|nr:cell division protein FtsX [Bacteroidota bacterium]MBK8366277.1 cell division protein FtsX [Bacteroidota bacterium]
MSNRTATQKLKTSSVTVVISLALVLFMLGLLGLVVINAKKLSNHIKENVGFQVVLKDTTTQAELDILKQEISSSAFTKEVAYISKDEAAKKLQKDLGEDFITFLGYNPLLSSLDVKLNSDYANIDSLAGFEKQIMQKHFVKEVIYHKDMIKQVNDNAKVISIYILIFSGLLLVVAIALINNTIRLSIYAKRFLIRTMYLVGATQGFIRMPFILKGVRQGVIAGLLAGFLLAGFLVLSTNYIPDLLQLQDPNLLAVLFGGIVALGVLISGLSAALSVSRYLRLKTDDLYF